MTISRQAFQAQISDYLYAPRWLVAYSGGVDSRVLLQLLVELPERPPLLAVHVNHQLQVNADAWEQHCRQQVEALGLEFIGRTVTVDCSARQSLEEAARAARYQAFESVLMGGDVLMMAHHLDDQVETLLLRLLRGSGSSGLASMPLSRELGRGVLLRPLLSQSRRDIEAYAESCGLQWVEDPSNEDCRFDRNFLRQQVLPMIEQRWPQYRATLARAAWLSEESAALNRELAESDFHALSLSPLADSLPIPALQQLSSRRQKNLLRFWLQSRQLPLPSSVQMESLLTEVIAARPDAEPLLEWTGVQVRRFRDELYAMKPIIPFIDPGPLPLSPSEPVTISGVGTVTLVSSLGRGIRGDCVRQHNVEVRFRRGGERCKPAGRANSQVLKKLLQEFGAETWLRERIPLLYIDGELAAVGDYWVCDGFAAVEGEPGYCCRWQRDI